MVFDAFWRSGAGCHIVLRSRVVDLLRTEGWLASIFRGICEVVTISSVVVSNLQISEEDIIDRGLAAALETIFDVIFIVEHPGWSLNMACNEP